MANLFDKTLTTVSKKVVEYLPMVIGGLPGVQVMDISFIKNVFIGKLITNELFPYPAQLKPDQVQKLKDVILEPICKLLEGQVGFS